ncbi:hypothetical protein A4X20_23870 [Mycolicibacterium iranicum]|uniref:Uncharacterized protein n=1 Tax=Mycolicibacterium iranicum TaxID=912594 RepID=A0A178LU58_MYCIR|nr:hypothetical protein A4X20_23870 [Mycolicibacterium iranicum]
MVSAGEVGRATIIGEMTGLNARRNPDEGERNDDRQRADDKDEKPESSLKTLVVEPHSDWSS